MPGGFHEMLMPEAFHEQRSDSKRVYVTIL
jgi:hypothetical protein